MNPPAKAALRVVPPRSEAPALHLLRLAGVPGVEDYDRPAGSRRHPLRVWEPSSARDGGKLLLRMLPEWTSRQHFERAALLKDLVRFHMLAWAEQADEAARRVFGRPFQFSDYKVDAIGREEFSIAERNALRLHAHGKTYCAVLAAAHEMAAAVSLRRERRVPAAVEHEAEDGEEEMVRERMRA